MKIAVIGAGMIGGTAARLFTRAGHQVALSNSRGPASLQALVDEIGPNAQAMTPSDAAAWCDVVVLAIPMKAYTALPAPQLAGKVVIDTMNYYPQRDGALPLDGLTSSELVARHLAGARVVKAFNTMYFQTLATQGKPNAPTGERLALFLAGDDADAKATVAHLIEEIGFAPVETGTLHEGGKRQEPGSPIYNRPMTGAAARAVLDSML